jgi:peroxiredoxin
MAALERLHLDFSGRGLQVVGISVDEDVFLVREYVFQEKLTFPMFLDPQAVVTGEVLGINAYPTSYLVDRSGRVAKVWVGAADWGSTEVQAEIVRSLAG